MKSVAVALRSAPYEPHRIVGVRHWLSRSVARGGKTMRGDLDEGVVEPASIAGACGASVTSRSGYFGASFLLGLARERARARK